MYIFDADFYKSLYDDLSDLSNEEALYHYNVHGKEEGRIINEKQFYDLYPEFDVNFYRAFYYDLSDLSNEKVLHHYNVHGKEEGRIINKKQFYDLYPEFDIENYKNNSLNEHLFMHSKYNLLKNLENTLMNILNTTLTHEMIIKAINDKISIEELFITNKMNYNLKYLILSLPKTGNNSIYNSIKQVTDDGVFMIHSIIELIYIDIRFVNYSIKEVINFISTKTIYDNLNIIISYREPQSRYISRYLWDIKIGFNQINYLENINEINNQELFDKIKNSDFTCYDNLVKDFDINLDNYKYDNLNGYTIVPYNDKISFIFTKMDDIEKFIQNFFNTKLNKLSSEEMNVNENNKKIIKFNKFFKDIIYENEIKFVKFYNYI
jgi:hypothetical protein